MSSQVTNYEHYFGSPDKLLITSIESESVRGIAQYDIFIFDFEDNIEAEFTFDSPNDFLEWLNSPYEGGKE